MPSPDHWQIWCLRVIHSPHAEPLLAIHLEVRKTFKVSMKPSQVLIPLGRFLAYGVARPWRRRIEDSCRVIPRRIFHLAWTVELGKHP
jgi:hypothetical protein